MLSRESAPPRGEGGGGVPLVVLNGAGQGEDGRVGRAQLHGRREQFLGQDDVADGIRQAGALRGDHVVRRIGFQKRVQHSD